MAFTPFSDDVQNISKLGDNPITDDNLTPQQFKARFDAAAVAIKDYINNTLIPELDSLLTTGAIKEEMIDDGAVTAPKLNAILPSNIGVKYGSTTPTTDDISDGEIYLKLEE